MKKILNGIDAIMDETIQGFVLENQKKLDLHANTHQVVRRTPKSAGKVKLVVGNGGGHEPGLMGWVGYGMFDLDDIGDVFAAQSGEAFYDGIKSIDNDGSPILMIIANHSGDVLNGNIAYNLAIDNGIKIKKVLFYDDIASAPIGFETERRGMAGIFFAVKTAGAAAEEMESLEKCLEIFEKTRNNTRTLSIALDGGCSPLTGEKMFCVPQDLVNIGGGIHGESGADTIPFSSSKEIAKEMCERLISDKPFVEGDEVLIEVNGSGATTVMELSIFYRDVTNYLTQRGLVVYDGVCGNFITTQDTSGLSLSICKIDGELKTLWNSHCCTPSYNNCSENM